MISLETVIEAKSRLMFMDDRAITRNAFAGDQIIFKTRWDEIRPGFMDKELLFSSYNQIKSFTAHRSIPEELLYQSEFTVKHLLFSLYEEIAEKVPAVPHSIELRTRHDQMKMMILVDAIVHYAVDYHTHSVVVAPVTKHHCKYCDSTPEELDKGRCPNCGAPQGA